MFDHRARVRTALAALITGLVLTLGVLPASAATNKDKSTSSTSASATPAGTNQSHGKKAKHGHQGKKGKKHHGASKSDKPSKQVGHNGKPGKKATKSQSKAHRAPRLPSTGCSAHKDWSVLNAAGDEVTAQITVKGCKGPQTLSSISHFYDLPYFLKDSCKVAKGQCGRYAPGVFDQTVTNGTYVVTVKVPKGCMYQVDWELNGHFFGSAHGGDHNCKGTTPGGGTPTPSSPATPATSTPDTGLALTGVNVGETVGLAALLLIGGIVFAFAGRRPRQDEASTELQVA